MFIMNFLYLFIYKFIYFCCEITIKLKWPGSDVRLSLEKRVSGEGMGG